MKVVRPIEFIWCGILYVPGQTEAYFRSDPFVGDLIGKFDTFSQVCDEDSNFTVDVMWQGSSQTVRDVVEDGIRFRTSCKRRHELGEEQTFLKPNTDCVGPRFVQMVGGDIEFLLAASRELHAEDGWPETLSGDIEEVIDLVTKEKGILCFIRPQIHEPFLLRTALPPTDTDTYKQYVQ